MRGALAQPAAMGRVALRPALLRRIGRVTLLHVLVAVGSIVFIIPLAWMVSVSFMSMDQAFTFPPLWIPRPPIVEPYVHGFVAFNFAVFFRNSAIITGLNVVGTVLSCSVVAYGFGRLRFPGRDALFLVLLSTMMLPQQVTMIPLYVWYARLGWVNTFLPLTVPAFFGNAFMIFLLRQFFRTIPRELEEAARIDGAGYFGSFWRVCLPLAKPAIGVVAIFIFIGTWNDFQLPLIYLQDQRLWTVAIGLLQFRGSTFMNLPSLMAMTCLVILPEIVLFFIAQRYFVQGVVMTGLKG